MKPLIKTLQINFKAARKKLGFSQSELASTLAICVTTISRIENGKSCPLYVFKRFDELIEEFNKI